MAKWHLQLMCAIIGSSVNRTPWELLIEIVYTIHIGFCFPGWIQKYYQHYTGYSVTHKHEDDIYATYVKLIN